MPGIVTEVLVIVALLALNGVFAMSELAIVTARKVRLQQRAEDGDAGAQAALALAHDPTRFLSTVQVGITLIGVLAGAFGGATIADELATVIARIPSLSRYANAIALGAVVTAITYLSLLIGELIPKRVALSDPERVAAVVARPMRILARVASPIVVLLTRPTNLVLRLFGIRVSSEPSITVDEIRALIEQGAESGVVEDAEHEMVMEVFRLGDHRVSDVMTPRADLRYIDIATGEEAVRRALVGQARAHVLVCEGTIENVLGVVHAEDVLVDYLTKGALDLKAVLQPPFFVPATMPALELIESFKEGRRRVAVVLDEYGGIAGAVMFADLSASLVGEIATGAAERSIQRRNEAEWTIRGNVSLDDLESELDLPRIAERERYGVRTVAGLVMSLLGHVPKVGESVLWKGVRFEVSEMIGRRITRLLVSKPRRMERQPNEQPAA